MNRLSPTELAMALPTEIEKLRTASAVPESVWTGLTQRAFTEHRVRWQWGLPPWWNWLPFVGILSERSRVALYWDWQEAHWNRRLWRTLRRPGAGPRS